MIETYFTFKFYVAIATIVMSLLVGVAKIIVKTYENKNK